jgi:hypothetical protein
LLGLARDIKAQHIKLTAVRQEQSSNQTNQRGLSRAVRADKRRQCAMRYLERNIVQGVDRPADFVNERFG